MRLDLRLRTFHAILENYRFDEPLSRFLGTFYRANKQMGGRDRRVASRMIYCYFRMGKALMQLPAEERLAIGAFLCETSEDDLNNELLNQYTSLNPSSIGLTIDEKLKLAEAKYVAFSLYDIFPHHGQLLAGIDKDVFLKSHLTQPKLWIRTQSAFAGKVIEELDSKAISYEIDAEIPHCIGFENATSLENLVAFEKGWFEIQDRSSQQVARFFKAQPNERWWDCCAASGGKSLLLASVEPTTRFTLTELRSTIVKNLENRLNKARIRPESIHCVDLCNNEQLNKLNLKPFDGIIADVPCSGSGTWGRTPEMLFSFDFKAVTRYNALQKQLVTQTLPFLKQGQPLIYITCSVFKQENDEVVDFLQKEKGLILEQSEIIQGDTCAADTMFVARLLKS